MRSIFDFLLGKKYWVKKRAQRDAIERYRRMDEAARNWHPDWYETGRQS